MTDTMVCDFCGATFVIDMCASMVGLMTSPLDPPFREGTRVCPKHRVAIVVDGAEVWSREAGK